ncbi:LysR family transcriptional regulator [Roseateles violae]|uniref:LysR family transcriptional regulator n=1 Tax=Roseateles violae TaxID=3058042 RepID=A0ABT8DXE6_9BURK|nr:LysR family transcriptional regulator [Pelomonas sp. PFR6]MDN3921437.1 LysR family transcriptional regulator [Pelomonas sp. PFR6]
MNLKQLEYFIRVAEHGSFSKAALLLDIAQPALSRQVRALETELREALFLRNGRGVTLTEAGARLLEHGQNILQMLANAREDLGAQRDEPLGRVVIGMPPTLARLHTLALIHTFHREMPKARLSVMEGFSVHITEWLLSGRADLALVYNPEPLPALEIEPLAEEHMSLVSPAAEAPGGPVALRDLPRYPLILPQRGYIFRKLMEQSAAMAGVQLNVAWEVSSLPVILDLVAAGMGHAVLGEAAIRQFPRPEKLALTRFAGVDIKSTLCLVTPAQKRATPLIKRSSEVLRRLVLNQA